MGLRSTHRLSDYTVALTIAITRVREACHEGAAPLRSALEATSTGLFTLEVWPRHRPSSASCGGCRLQPGAPMSQARL